MKRFEDLQKVVDSYGGDDRAEFIRELVWDMTNEDELLAILSNDIELMFEGPKNPGDFDMISDYIRAAFQEKLT